MNQLCTRLLLLGSFAMSLGISATYVDLIPARQDIPPVLRLVAKYFKPQGPCPLPLFTRELSLRKLLPKQVAEQEALHQRELIKFGLTTFISNLLIPTCIGLRDGYTHADLSSSLKGLALATSGAYVGNKFIAPIVSKHRFGNAAFASAFMATLGYRSGHEAGKILRIVPNLLHVGTRKAYSYLDLLRKHLAYRKADTIQKAY